MPYMLVRHTVEDFDRWKKILDESRAGTRRWCSMGDCGNRAKARRHYHKSKES